MLSELQRLREYLQLARLLGYYAQLNPANQPLWQSRAMKLEGVEAPELVKLHGELISCEWIEINIGTAAVKETRKVGGCYRATAAGLRALKLVQAEIGGEESEEAIAVLSETGDTDIGTLVKKKRNKQRTEKASVDGRPSAESMEDHVPVDAEPSKQDAA